LGEITSYRFDPFRIDVRRAVLCRGEATVPLRPKSYDVLLHLVRNAGRVVSKDELLRDVWAGVIVTDNSLAQCIREIREALGDERATMVETASRRGYVFAAPVIAATDEGPAAAPVVAPRASKRGGLLALAAVAILAIAIGTAWWLRAPPSRDATGRLHVAVMPFASQSGEDYFSRGVSADVAAALGRFPEIAVASPDLVAHLRAEGKPMEDIARDLNVRYLVGGTLERASDKLRIAVRLTELPRGVLLWSQSYDAPAADLASVQDAITSKLAGALAVKVGSAEARRSSAKAPGTLQAYDFVLRGREGLTRLNRTSHSQARAAFEQALALDSNYAAAYVGLGRVDLSAAAMGWTPDPQGALARAEHAALRAIALDESDARAHVLLGRALARQGQYDRAVETLRRAVALNRSDPDAYAGLGDALLWGGDATGAVESLEAAFAADPRFSGEDFFSLGAAYFLAGRGADAIRVLERATARNEGNPFIYALLAAAYADAGRADDARNAAAQVRRMDPFFDVENFGTLFRRPEHRQRLASALKASGL
jgi:adenylate cyclase